MSSPLNSKEKEMITAFNEIVIYCKNNCEEFDNKINYGLAQIEDEINLRIKELKADGSEKTVAKYGDLDNMIRDFKKSLSEYYKDYIEDDLFKYELLK